MAPKEIRVEKSEVKTTLRYPQKLKEEFKRIADEEGLSENAALVQGLVWWLKYQRENATCAVKTAKPQWLQPLRLRYQQI